MLLKLFKPMCLVYDISLQQTSLLLQFSKFPASVANATNVVHEVCTNFCNGTYGTPYSQYQCDSSGHPQSYQNLSPGIHGSHKQRKLAQIVGKPILVFRLT